MRATTASHIQTRQRRKPKISRQLKNNENQQKTPRKTTPAKDADYHQLVTRATKDAVRDWSLANDDLTWPQGLDTLLGYSPGKSDQTIAFWQRQIHRSDRSRTRRLFGTLSNPKPNIGRANIVFGCQGALPSITGTRFDCSRQQWASGEVHWRTDGCDRA